MDISRIDSRARIAGLDKRQLQRKVLRLEAIFTLEGSTAKPAQTLDVGTGGMSLNVTQQLPVGQVLDVVFEVVINGEKHKVAAKTRVSHCTYSMATGFKVGLQFLHIDPESTAAIERYMKA